MPFSSEERSNHSGRHCGFPGFEFIIKIVGKSGQGDDGQILHFMVRMKVY